MFALVFPVRATNLMDDGATAVSEAAQAGFSPRASDLITREAVYQTWLVGNFGSAESPIATEYGPRLMSALTYSWSDVKRMNADPSAQEAIDKAKAAEFKKIAAEVEKKDPAAYASFTGKTDTRTAGTILGGVWVLIMGFFVVLASVITVVARLIMIALVVAAPIVVVVGVVKYAVLQRMWDLFTAALVNIVKFTIAAGAMTLILGAIYTAPVGMGWRLLFAIVATVVAIMITKPVASFKSMAGLDPTRSYLGPLLRRAGGTAVGVVAGQKLSDSSGDAGSPHDVSTTYRVQPVEPSMPPLPPPTTAYVLQGSPASAARSDGRPALQSQSVAAAEQRGLPTRVLADPNALPAGSPGDVADEPPQRQPGTLVPLVAVAAARRPVVTEHTAVPATVEPSGTGPPAIEPNDRPVTSGGRAPLVAVADAGRPAAVDGARTVNPVDSEPAPRAVAPPVAYPTGIVVQNDPGLYRTDRALRIEEYLKFPEPHVDANGEETWTPLYRAKASR